MNENETKCDCVWCRWWQRYWNDFLPEPTSTKAANLLREAQHYGWNLDASVRARLKEWIVRK